MIGLKIIIILLVIATFSTVSAGTLMPEISWFNFQGVEVLEGIAQIEQIGWDFICESPRRWRRWWWRRRWGTRRR